MDYLKITELLAQPIGMNASTLQGAVEYLEMRMSNPQAMGLPTQGSASGITVGELNGVGVLELTGTFVPRMLAMDALCMGDSFISTNDATLAFIDLASKYDTILLNMSSGGGSLTGVPELAEAIRNSPSKVIGFTDTSANSAAYWVLSACDEIVATPSASIGNIGVYIPVMKRGSDSSVKTHYFGAGKTKLYGAPDVELSDDARKYFQDKVDSTYAWFTESVAGYRGVDLKEIKETEADVYLAKDVVGLLVDRLVNNVWEV